MRSTEGLGVMYMKMEISFQMRLPKRVCVCLYMDGKMLTVIYFFFMVLIFDFSECLKYFSIKK